MDSIIDKTAIQNVIKQYTGVDDADEARNKLLSRGLFSKARDAAEETRGQVSSAVSQTVEDALASVAGLTNLTISKRTLPEDQETPDLPEDQPGELFDDPAMRTFETDLYEAKREKPTDAKVISDPNDADGGAASGKEFDATVKDFLELNEGNENTPYQDTLGNWTVGIGHYIGKTLPERFKNSDGTPKTLTDTQVQMLFEKDYKEHKEDAAKLPMYSQLDNKGKQALIDLTFNMGNEKFNEDEWKLFFTALKNKDLKTAAKELKNSKWYNQVGDRAPRVINLIKGAKFI